jgi:hypothetical protein
MLGLRRENALSSRFAFLAALVTGCGGSKFPEHIAGDAGPGDGAPGHEPTPPTVPEPSRMTPCPDGWREVEDPYDPQMATCDPWPEGGPLPCAIDEAHFPGRPSCERIGTSCPAGDWAEDIPPDASIVYVLAGAPAGGDGTPAAPFGSIRDAIVAAPSDAVVAISKGTFDEAVVVTRPLTLWGACVAETVLAPSTASDDTATIRLTTRAGATVRNLQITGPRPGVHVLVRSSLEAVLVRAASVVGISVGADLAATDLIVRDTGARSDRHVGYGLEVGGGAHLDLSRAAFEGNRTVGVLAGGAGTELVATDFVVRETEPQESNRGLGDGLDLLGGVQAVVTRAALSGNRNVGILIAEPGTHLDATDLVVRDTQAQESDDDYGYALEIHGGAGADLTRTTFERNRSGGIILAQSGTRLAAEDLIVRETASRLGDGRNGDGIEVQDGAVAELTRATFEGNATVGILVKGAGAQLTATDVVVRETQARASDDTFGCGLDIYGGATADLTRAVFDGNRSAGIIAAEAGTEIVARDLSVHDTQADESDGAGGYGLDLYRGAVAELTRAAFEGNRGFGVLVGDEGTEATCEDLLVQQTMEQDCAPDSCERFGTAVSVIDGASVGVTSFRVSDNALCGIQLARGGVIDLHVGEVSANAIGANIQTEGFALERLQDGVTWRDNEADLDSSSLPLPEVIDGTEL